MIYCLGGSFTQEYLGTVFWKANALYGSGSKDNVNDDWGFLEYYVPRYFLKYSSIIFSVKNIIMADHCGAKYTISQTILSCLIDSFKLCHGKCLANVLVMSESTLKMIYFFPEATGRVSIAYSTNIVLSITILKQIWNNKNIKISKT